MNQKQSVSVVGEENLVSVEFSEIEEDPLLSGMVTEALLATGRGEDRRLARVVVIITGDEQLKALNKDYRGFDEPTDVLSFDLSDGDDSEVEGDIYISLTRAAAQSAERKLPVEEEVVRLAVHGFLHLCGWDHDDDEELGSMVERGELYVQGASKGSS